MASINMFFLTGTSSSVIHRQGYFIPDVWSIHEKLSRYQEAVRLGAKHVNRNLVDFQETCKERAKAKNEVGVRVHYRIPSC